MRKLTPAGNIAREYRSGTAVLLLAAVLAICAQAGVSEPDENAAPANVLSRDGLIREWFVLGPFPNPTVELSAAPDGVIRPGFHKDYLGALGGEGKAVIGRKTRMKYRSEDGTGSVAEARPVRTEDGVVNFHASFPDMDHKVAYAYACIESPTNQIVHFFLGSDDCPKVWINGRLAHEVWIEGGRGMVRGDDYFTAELRAGRNTVLVKVEDDRGDWQFVLEACDDQNLAALQPPRPKIQTRSFRTEVSLKARGNSEVVLPTAYDDDPLKKWPLVVFLGYAGGGPSTLGEAPSPFVVLLPRCPLLQEWSLDVLDALLAQAVATYRVDPKRIYLAGSDAGAIEAWEWAMKSPEWFAAMAPAGGQGDPRRASRLKNVPIWMFHVAGQDGQPVEPASAMLNALKICGADVQLTTCSQADAGFWDRTYNDPALYEWFLKHQRGVFRKPTIRGANFSASASETQGLPPGNARRIIHSDQTGHDYEIVPVEGGITWDDARRRAEAMTHSGMRGHLATITSSAENDLIVSNFGRAANSPYCFWLGGFQPPGSPEPAGNWQWVTGEPWDYANWAEGEPNNECWGEYGGYWGEGESAIQLYGRPGQWNDSGAYSYQPGFIVEYSTNLPLVGTGESAPPVAPAPRGERKRLGVERTITQDVSCVYSVCLPEGYGRDPNGRWPVVVFLNYRGAWPSTLGKDNTPFPFVVVRLPTPMLQWWGLDLLEAVLDEVIREYRADTDRLYLTGASTGGFYTWAWAIKSPHRFAAIAPLCGEGDPRQAYLVKEVPAWVFHGAKDFLSVVHSEIMVDALRACGADVKFTVYPDLGHNIWDETYTNAPLYEWFLTHSRPHDGAPPR
jgi:dienelactone hydrolase